MERFEIQVIPRWARDFLNAPWSIEKNVDFFNNVANQTFIASNLSIDGKTIYYSHVIYTIKKNNKSFFLFARNKRGFTFKDGKLKYWFGTPIGSSDLIGFMKYLPHLDWIPEKCYQYINRPILESIFKGNCTNPINILKRYLSYRRIKCSPYLFYKLVMKHNEDGYYANEFVRHYYCIKNPERMLFDMVNKDYYGENIYHQDIYYLALKLDFKIDHTWSAKRMKYEHDEMVKTLMRIEKNIIDEEIEYPRHVDPKDRNFIILRNKVSVYSEGTSMKHCIYTNYWNAIREGRYMAVHCFLPEREATLGLMFIPDTGFRFDQIQGINNARIKDEERAIAVEWLEKLNALSGYNVPQLVPEFPF